MVCFQILKLSVSNQSIITFSFETSRICSPRCWSSLVRVRRVRARVLLRLQSLVLFLQLLSSAPFSVWLWVCVSIFASSLESLLPHVSCEQPCPSRRPRSTCLVPLAAAPRVSKYTHRTSLCNSWSRIQVRRGNRATARVCTWFGSLGIPLRLSTGVVIFSSDLRGARPAWASRVYAEYA